MRLSELLRREVVSESGSRFGHVHDLRGELEDGRLRVTGLVVAGRGFLERFGVGTGGSGGANRAKVHGHPAIPWERVVRVGSEIVVRDSEAGPS
jgi:sporulation protein YlmC with PRC-barrel domain